MGRTRLDRSLRAVLLAAVVSWPAALASQGAPPVTGDTAHELAGIRASLDRLVTLMETQVRQQQMGLLIRRIELAERRIEPLEQRLRDAEDSLRNREEELERLRTMIVEQESSVDEAVRVGNVDEESIARSMLNELREVLRREEPLMGPAAERVRRLEDRIADEREEIEALDERLLELLD